MTCPVCAKKTIVVHCRRDCETVQRKRKCVDCGHIFFTEEVEIENGNRYKELDYQYNLRRKLKARKKT